MNSPWATANAMRARDSPPDDRPGAGRRGEHPPGHPEAAGDDELHRPRQRREEHEQHQSGSGRRCQVLAAPGSVGHLTGTSTVDARSPGATASATGEGVGERRSRRRRRNMRSPDEGDLRGRPPRRTVGPDGACPSARAGRQHRDRHRAPPARSLVVAGRDHARRRRRSPRCRRVGEPAAVRIRTSTVMPGARRGPATRPARQGPAVAGSTARRSGRRRRRRTSSRAPG